MRPGRYRLCPAMSRVSARFGPIAAVVATTGWFFAAVAFSEEGEPPRPTVPYVLLITLDTTRADHLGCYGDRDALTPALDALAARGTLFEEAFTPCPMTLPAHATILTGLLPPEHGLRVNGRNSLGPNIRTLAEVLQAEGYQTAAFVAAFVLNAKFGLNHGFTTYDDSLTGAQKQEVPEPLSVYRPGNLVTDAALAWLAQAVDAGRPFFCWVHLYDPHYPYYRHAELSGTQFADVASYDAEIAFMDRQVGRLTAFLEQRGLTSRTLVIAIGDHGEGLEDHGEVEHGYLLNDEVLHVPFIVSLPGRIHEGQRVAALVSLADVLPTVLDVLGTDLAERASARSLWPAFFGVLIPSRPSYAETELPYVHFGWSPMRSLTTESWKYVRSTRPELYDRRGDRHESRNLAASYPKKIAKLEGRLAAMERMMDRRSAPRVTLRREERQRLEALGYVADGQETPAPLGSGALQDIKDMLPLKHLETKLARGIALGTLSEEERLAIERELVRRSPETPGFQNTLGTALIRADDLDEAIAHFSEALRLRPDFAEAHSNLGNALLRQGKLDEAIGQLTQALDLKPDLAEAHLSMGNALTARGSDAQALEHYADALRLNPDYAEAHCNMGNALARQRDVGRAMEHYREALRIQPDFALAHHNLAMLLAEQDRLAEATAHYEAALRSEPHFASAHFHLAQLLAEEGRHARAIAHYQEAARLKPNDADIADNLAAAYAAAGQLGNATQMAHRAQELARAAGQETLAQDIERRLAVYQRMTAARRRPPVRTPAPAATRGGGAAGP
jgi:arylsulfatase A-like enzyme/Flp pilus assembly protein TadD